MTRGIKAQNIQGFGDGTITKPKDDPSKSLKWERANVVTSSWILGSISESIYVGHACSENSHDIWTELPETQHKADGSIVFNIHQKINSQTQSGPCLSEYFSKLDSLWKEFDGLTNIAECTCEASKILNGHSKLMKLMQFLSGLDESYNKVKSHILLMDPLPNVKVAFSIVSREESHQKQNSFKNPSIVSKTQTSAFSSRVNNQRRNKTKGPIPQCKNYGLKGHSIEKCFKLIGYPKEYKPKSDFNNTNINFSGNTTSFNNSECVNNYVSSDTSKSSDCHFLTSEQYNQFIRLDNENQRMEDGYVIVNANVAGIACNSFFNFQSWVVDSGANQHMTASESLLHDTVDVSNLNLIVCHPNGSTAQINKIGNMQLSNSLILFDVFVVPDFNINLLSVHKLCKDSKSEVVFNEHKCIVQDSQSKEMVETGNQIGGLYYMNTLLQVKLKLIAVKLNVVFQS